MKFLLTLRIEALITICDLKSLLIFAEVSRFRVGVLWGFFLLISLVAERVIVIIAFNSQAILLSE